jgi:pSer/pThr/pTyr-binding forkhead associated (FHA) protein
MRINTPRATPVVRAPAPSVRPLAEQAPPLLRVPVSIITPVAELELRDGSILVGRLPECDVMVDDALVSRMHARISVRGESVVVEDLHSTNGIYVNGARITHSATLREGDRLLVGTTEISLFEARRSARVTPLRLRSEQSEVTLVPPAPPSFPPSSRSSTPPPAARGPKTLPPGEANAFGKLELHLDELDGEPEDNGPASWRGADLQGLRSRNSSVPSTARADALDVIGALAERLAASGNVDEANRVLSAHLRRILQGATAGLTVPEDVRLLASKHALSLARWTGISSWIDYAVELHVAARCVMSPQTLTLFESVTLSIGEFDRQLLTYYIDGLRGERALLSAEERLVLERLINLNAI